MTPVVIVGLGRIGMGYDLELDPSKYVYSHARAFSLHPEFRLVAGVDTEPERRRTFEAAYGCDAQEHLDAALRRHQPGLVVIATPTDTHASTLATVLEGCQPRVIVCEKPLSYDDRQARGMVDACKARGIELYVNYMRRSEPGAVEVKRRIDAGSIGPTIKGVVWYSKGFFHNGSHFFNLLEYWLGPAQRSTLMSRGPVHGSVDGDPEPDAHVEFERGSAVFLAAWEEAYSHYTVELVSASGRLRYEKEGRSIEWQQARPDPQFEGYRILSDDTERIDSGFDRYQWHVAEELARALRGEAAQLCTGMDACRTIEAMTRVLG